MKIMFSKALVLAVIVLFIGAGVVPSISGNIPGAREDNKKSENFLENIMMLDQLDQNQSIYDVNIIVSRKIGDHSPLLPVQSFTPTLDTLTRVDLLMEKTGFPDYNNIKLSIRNNQSDDKLIETTKLLEDIPSGLNWNEFHFSTLNMSIGETYYIVIEPSGGDYELNDTSYLCWGGSIIDHYQYGDAWLIQEGSWYLNDWGPPSDYCFKTYGLSQGNADIQINVINGGFRSSAVIINNGTATANDVNWSIDLEGGLIIAGSHTEGIIDELASGASKTIRQTTLYGIGRTTITVTAGDATEQATGFILGPLVLGVEEI